MADRAVAVLVQSIIAGELTAVAPLLDRLEELNDCRRHDLWWWTGELIIGHHHKGMIDVSTECHNLLKRSRWEQFSGRIRQLFWVEIFTAESLQETLWQVQNDMDTVALAAQMHASPLLAPIQTIEPSGASVAQCSNHRCQKIQSGSNQS